MSFVSISVGLLAGALAVFLFVVLWFQEGGDLW